MAQEQIPQGFMDEFRALKREVAELRKAAPLRNASITGGKGLRVSGEGGITVEGGGDVNITDLGRLLVDEGGSVRVKDTQSRDLFYAGGLTETIPGTPQGHAVMLYRLDGTTALALIDDADDEQVQRLKLYDRNGAKILAEDPQGDGLEWPAVPIPFGALDYTKWAGTTSTTFTGLLSGFTYRMHRRAFVSVRHTTDVSGTTGEVRLLANGTPVGSTLAVGFSVSQALIGPFTVPGAGGEGVNYTLQGRVTAGTGQIRADIDYAWAGGFF